MGPRHKRLEPVARVRQLAVLALCICLFVWIAHLFQVSAVAIYTNASRRQQGQKASCNCAAATAAQAAAEGKVAAAGWWGKQGDERSFYLKWIQQDLERYTHTGITQQMVDHSFALARLCEPESIRIQVINGSLWAENAAPKPEGYYPQELGPGWVSGKGRIPYYLLAIMEALHLFPGQIPDLDIVAYPGDYPCIQYNGRTVNNLTATPPWGEGQEAASKAGFKSKQAAEVAASPPILGFNSRAGVADLPFPDFSYYGHEVGILDDEQGQWVFGWDAQMQYYSRKFGDSEAELAQRWPQLVWRGRYDAPRDYIRRRWQDCHKYLADKGLDGDVMNVWDNRGLPGINLLNICGWRYTAYLESDAWSTSFKQKMMCGSITVAPVMEFYEFFARALQPGVHYIEISQEPNVMCDDMYRNIKAMNEWFDQHKAQANAAASNASSSGSGGSRGRSSKAAGSSKEDSSSGGGGGEGGQVGGAVRRRALLAKDADGNEVYLPKAKQKYRNPWDSDLTPAEVAQSARQFLRDHVRMWDAQLYIRDLLQHYAKLQRFKPQPQPGSVKYSGKKLLDDVGIPHKVDAYQIASQYPWLTYWHRE